MPAMITHYLIAERVLPVLSLITDREAFLLGAQGPDIFFFFRAYPWLIGKNGLPVGNALHDVRPSVLADTLRAILDETFDEDQGIVSSYIYGFLCHYAADRTLHPFVCCRQQELQVLEPTFAKTSNHYHYRYESALDTLLLRHETGENVTAFRLTTVIPKADKCRDEVLARFYHRLIKETLNQDVSERALQHLTSDMRHSMRLMTDSTELKGKMFRLAEFVCRCGSKLSPLLRTNEVGDYDFANVARRKWTGEDGVVQTRNFYELCNNAVLTALTLISGFAAGKSGIKLTNDIDFAGCRWEDKSHETNRKL